MEIQEEPKFRNSLLCKLTYDNPLVVWVWSVSPHHQVYSLNSWRRRNLREEPQYLEATSL